MRPPRAYSSVQLPSKRADDSAAEDGALLMDRAAPGPVVTIGGVFRPLAVLVDVPPTATSPGAPGHYAVNATHLYLCRATDTWVRVAVSTF